ncbi:VHS domain-containing protein [Sarocladium implicatum]|nr:VHS domain-containing protein [Sarocladium implicatum]
MSLFQQKHPYSAITVTIENLTSETYEEEDPTGIIELVDVIKLQATGPSEAARAIRKKLKYGNVHRQLRALVILDFLILNAGPRFQRGFANEPLLERLRVCGTSDLSDPAVKNKCRVLFRGWASYAGTPGLNEIAKLHKELPRRKQVVTQAQSKVVQETENPFGDEEEEAAAAEARARRDNAGSSSSHTPIPAPLPLSAQSKTSTSGGGSSSFFGSSSKDKKKGKGGKRRPFNLEEEKENMKSAIADSSLATTNLMNALQSINREKERISENPQAVQHFEACKQLRRRILRYIHHVESEQWLGGLLNANDQLVHALMSFEQLDRSIAADSDSDDEIAEQAHMYRMAQIKGKEGGAPPPPDVGGLSINDSPSKVKKAPSPPPPPRPPRPAMQRQDTEEDEDDPFGDSNVVETPAIEKGQPSW